MTRAKTGCLFFRFAHRLYIDRYASNKSTLNAHAHVYKRAYNKDICSFADRLFQFFSVGLQVYDFKIRNSVIYNFRFSSHTLVAVIGER